MSHTTTDTEDVSFRRRLAEHPRPAAIWAAVLAVLLALEFGALVHFGFEVLHAVAKSIPGKPLTGLLLAAIEAAADIPTLLSRELVANQGYWNGEHWVNTFHVFDVFYLSPKHAWLLRVLLVYAYAFTLLWWVWRGFQTYRTHYRTADWTPRDDQIDRFSRHTWGKFGAVVVFGFMVMALFAPTLSPTTLQQNILDPYSYQLKYWSESAKAVEQTLVGQANLRSASQGSPDNNVGPWSYDQFGRFHPFGTLTTGKDLFTFMMYGSRISLFIALGSMALAAFVASLLAMVTAYYKGLVDLVTVVLSDGVQSLPVLMIIILLSVVFSDTWIANVYNGALLLLFIFALIYWPYLWRSVRGPAFQVAEEEWIDAAKSYGQTPLKIMQKHMAPYIVGYLLVYGSMSLGGIIISVASLSFLGLGITPPTPEWGRAVSAGQPYVATASWHIALIPGILITIVVTGFNAFGDGVRDAIDPQSEGEGGSADEAAAAGGGG
ncbi:ABC transporter permease [Halospeciosus flavus]|uniref:ABC transporter permease n=1 Tax=Halospeciosus flavus TaxID=3032283 RepID=A0ABD5Z746_9EURY|nr:ABC transporter permease [Halospeciosus flavus]